MEIKITMLGTSGSSPTRTRSMPGVALSYNGIILLFDCGEGAQMQMLKYGINFSRIRAIFISHAHGDHVIGLAGLVRTLAMNRRTSPLDIFVPKEYESVIKTLISFDKALITYRINVRGVGSGVVYRGKGFSVNAFPVKHSIPSCGYAFREDDGIRFIEKECRRLGIKGEMHSLIQAEGRLKVGNRTIMLEQVTTVQHGKKVVYATDTRPARSTVLASKGADLLIHESSYSEAEVNLARERKHSTSKEAAEVAKKAGVKALLLTHISARYNSTDEMEKTAKRVFFNSKVAKDGDVIFV